MQQPPSRLTLLFPFTQADVKVITGGYETVQVKITGDAAPATGGYDIEYDGAHVALIEQQASTNDTPQMPPSRRTILAKVPERYCHVGLHTAGGTVEVQSITEASLRVATCSGAVTLGKIKASSVDVDTAGGSLQCQVITADRADIKTAGGAITIGRLVGQHCNLDAQSRSPGSSLGSGSIQVDVAYTESLQVKTGSSSITFGSLDTMNGNAALSSQGGDIAVDGLDGTASLQSHGGNIQVKLQEGVREVEALSGGGAISCKLPPAPATFSAALEPKSNVALGDGIKLEGQGPGTPGILRVGNTSASGPVELAKQQSTTDRQGTEQPQTALPAETMQASQPAVKLLLDARKTASDSGPSGRIVIATESWLERATAKAKASMRDRSGDKSVS